MMMMSVPEATGTATSRVARKIRCSRGSRCARAAPSACSPPPARESCVTMFSTTTTAASTSMPMAIASPPKDIRFADRPNQRMSTKVASAAKGRISATVSAARRSPRNSTSISITSTTACASAVLTVVTARSTSWPRS